MSRNSLLEAGAKSDSGFKPSCSHLNFNIKVLLSTICHDDCSRLPHFLCYHSLYFIVAEGPVICMSPITN